MARRLTVLTVLAALVTRVAAQQPGSLDLQFAAVAGTDSAPTLLAPLADGRLYVAGTFTNYGGTGRARVARLLADGRVDTGFTLGALTQVNPAVILNGQVIVPASTNAGAVEALLPLPDGRAVVAGPFNQVGNRSAPAGVAVLALDGSVAAAPAAFNKFQSSTLLQGPADTFYVSGKGVLEGTRLPLLRVRVDGTRDTTFTPPTLVDLKYASANPFYLRSGPGDTLYAITFAAVGATPTSDILRLTASGSLDTTFAGTGKANIPYASLSSFVTDAVGRMTFTAVTSYRGETLTRKINRLQLDGAIDPTYQSAADPGFGGRVVAVQPDGKLLYTGGQLPINRLNADGTVDTGYVNPGKVPVTQNFLSLTQFALAPDGSLFAGGFTFSPAFTPIFGAYHLFGDPNSAPSIVRQPVVQTNTLGARTRFSVLAQGAPPLTYQWYRNGTPINGATDFNLILDSTTAADGNAEYHCVVSNEQGSAPSLPARLTLLEPRVGQVYRETDVPVGADAVILDLQFDSAGGLIAAGGFTKFHGTNRVRVARLLQNGGLVDPAYDTSGLGAVSLVQDVLPLRSGKLLATGGFSINYNNMVHNGSLRLNANGSLDGTFNPTGTGTIFPQRFAEGIGSELWLAASEWNGATLGSAIGRLSADGVGDPAFAATPAYFPTGLVLALPDGKVLVGGRTNGQSGVSGVIRLNADGSQDPTFFRGPFPGFASPSVTSLLRQPDGRILVGGRFSRTIGSPAYTFGVIRLLADGQWDSSFNPIPSLSAMTGFPVQRLALQADGRILIQGAFTAIGGYARPGVARLWPNGVVDPEFSVGSPRRSYLSGNPLGTVAALAVSPSNEIYLGGDFHEFDALPRTNFVRLSGGPLRLIPAAPSVIRQPVRMVAKEGTSVTMDLEIGGEGPFQYQWRRNDPRGSTNFVDLVGATNSSLTLPSVRYTLPSDSGLFEVQVVNPGGSVVSRYITLLVEPEPVVPGSIDASFAAVGASGILSGQTQLADPAPEGQIYVSVRTTVLRQFEDGTPDVSFRPPSDLTSVPEGGVSAILRQPDGKLLVAGRLHDGALARLLPDGSYDPDFIRTNGYTGFAQNVPWELGIQRDGRILLAGTFENFAGRAVNGLIRFLTNGAVDPAFPLNAVELAVSNPPRVLPGAVVSLRVLPDDRMYVGGGLTRVQGVSRIGFARLQPDGTLDPTFVPPTDGATPAGTAGSMLFSTLGPVTSDGGIYLFGSFRRSPNGPTESALRLYPDGSVDDTFHVTTDFPINSGVVQSDGILLITGQFTQLNGQGQLGFARLNRDGSTDTGFKPGNGFGAGGAMRMLPDGKLLVVGVRYFTGVGPAVPSPELGFVLKSGNLELSWPTGYQLQRTLSLLPPNWQTVPTPSPFTVHLSGPGEFYRILPVP